MTNVPDSLVVFFIIIKEAYPHNQLIMYRHEFYKASFATASSSSISPVSTKPKAA
jgi:hypothetical protein